MAGTKNNDDREEEKAQTNGVQIGFTLSDCFTEFGFLLELGKKTVKGEKEIDSGGDGKRQALQQGDQLGTVAAHCQQKSGRKWWAAGFVLKLNC